jgi:hypothetical protein
MWFRKNRVAPAARASVVVPDNMCVCAHRALHPDNPGINPGHVAIHASGRCLVSRCPCVHDPDGFVIHEEDEI